MSLHVSPTVRENGKLTRHHGVDVVTSSSWCLLLGWTSMLSHPTDQRVRREREGSSFTRSESKVNIARMAAARPFGHSTSERNRHDHGCQGQENLIDTIPSRTPPATRPTTTTTAPAYGGVGSRRPFFGGGPSIFQAGSPSRQ
jgi:hypothetical protein